MVPPLGFAVLHTTASSPSPFRTCFPSVLGGAVEFAYKPHTGPVHGVALSFHLENVFATCGTDGQVKLFHKLQSHPLMVLDPRQSALLSVAFHPTRPAVLFVASSEGTVAIYDLLVRTQLCGCSIDALDPGSGSTGHGGCCCGGYGGYGG